METSDIPLVITIGILIFLLLASAFFSGSETALTRARKVRLRLLSEQGNRGAKRAIAMQKAPEKMLSTILIGNNFVNFAAVSLTTAIFVVLYGDRVGPVYATIASTIIFVIFAEVLPKTFAVAHAEAVSCRVALLLGWIQKLIYPLVWLLMLIVHIFRRLFRVPDKEDTGLTHQELSTIIDLSAESGVLDQAREQMLMSSLHLHEVPVKALMTPRKNVVFLDAGKSVARCIAKAMQHPHSRYPVYHGATDHLIGIVHLRDLIKIEQKSELLVNAVIWKTPPYIPASKNALSQLFAFQSQRQHLAIIVDEFGDIDGLITLEDIIEEIVGEIDDESDAPSLPEMWKQPDGSMVVTGTASVHDINTAMDIDLPEEGSTTISGLIFEILGDQPDGRVCLIIGNVRIEVLRIEGHWIKRVRVKPADNKPHE